MSQTHKKPTHSESSAPLMIIISTSNHGNIGNKGYVNRQINLIQKAEYFIFLITNNIKLIKKNTMLVVPVCNIYYCCKTNLLFFFSAVLKCNLVLIECALFFLDIAIEIHFSEICLLYF